MAEHYGTAVIPARVRKPKEKPGAEGTVGIISTWIIAALRDQTCFSLSEINAAISGKLVAFNHRPFQKKPDSRYRAFLDEEKYALQLLPASAYECATRKIATVQYNYHIAVENMHYSVPNEYIEHKLDVRMMGGVTEVFYNQHRICSHPRLYGRTGQYHTVIDHMPEKHKNYLQWDTERYVSWANKVGPYTRVTIQVILTGHRIEQQGYRACMGIVKLADRYYFLRLEAACERALRYIPNPGYKHISTILKSGQDILALEPTKEDTITDRVRINTFGLTRGAIIIGENNRC